MKFNLYISQAVVDEISVGDPDAVSRRLAFVAKLPILGLTEEVEILAKQYLNKLGLPRGASLDVVHLANAVIYEMDYLLTWNCVHLANGLVIKRLQKVNAILGRLNPIIGTPEELLESPEGG